MTIALLKPGVLYDTETGAELWTEPEIVEGVFYIVEVVIPADEFSTFRYGRFFGPHKARMLYGCPAFAEWDEAGEVCTVAGEPALCIHKILHPVFKRDTLISEFQNGTLRARREKEWERFEGLKRRVA